MYWLYSKHIIGYTWCRRELTLDERTCRTCGAVDELIGTFTYPHELRELLYESGADLDEINDLVLDFIGTVNSF